MPVKGLQIEGREKIVVAAITGVDAVGNHARMERFLRALKI